MTSRFPRACENLEFLCHFFSDPWIFTREWVQSAIATESSSIEFSLAFSHPGQEFADSEVSGELQLKIRDDGRGFELDFMESQIATLLSRAPKAGEWTSGDGVFPYFDRIGTLEGFQLAFLSLFVLMPSSLRIQTGERNFPYSTIVRFEKEVGLEISRLEESFSGLEIVWTRPLSWKEAQHFEGRLRGSIETWCKYCPLEIRYSLTSLGTDALWSSLVERSTAWRDLADQSQLSLPVNASEGLNTTEVLVGSSFPLLGSYAMVDQSKQLKLAILPSRERQGKYELYSSGIWLTEGEGLENAPPGIHFRADSILLNSTSTRDGVCSDQGLRTVVNRCHQVVNEQLRPSLFRAAASSDDPEERERLWGYLTHRLRALPLELARLPLVPTLEGGRCSIVKLRWSVWNWGGLYWSSRTTSETAAFSSRGIPVLRWDGPDVKGARLQTFLEAAIPGVKLSKVESQSPPFSNVQLVGGAFLSTMLALGLRLVL